MAQGLKCWGWGLGLVGALALSAFSGDRALAQSNIVADDTLGAENSVVRPNFNGLPVEVIQGGAQRGQNLFHSFEEFNIDADRGAYFFSPADIQNILARVTGSNRSEIMGTLGTFGDSTPNLFLINPNGILFGQGAKLDVGGSFVATTANAVGLGGAGLFSASEPETSTLLAINPNAFFFNQLSNQAEIVNRSTATTPVLGRFINGLPRLSGLHVPEGRSVLLLGGNVRLEGGVLQTPGGRVELGGLSAVGTVGLNLEGNTLNLSFPNEVARADVSLTNRAQVRAAAGGGGSIAINAQTVELLGGSIIFTGIAPGLGSVDSRAGDIEINATVAITVSELSFLANQVFGIGNGGDVEITTNSLSVTDGAQLLAATFGRGDAGNVRIIATDTVSFAGVGSDGLPSAVFSSVASGAEGNSGDVEITTNSLSVTNGAQLLAATFGRGDAGNVKITASDTVSFAGVSSNGFFSAAGSTVEEGAIGKGGDVEIITNSLSVTDGAQLATSTRGRGDAGNVKITASDTVSFAGVGSNGFSSGAFSSVAQQGEGKGGNVEITANSLSVTDGALLVAGTDGQGNAGNVRITASDTVSFAGVGSNGLSSEVFSGVEPGGEGNGGDVEITTNSLSVTDGAQLVAATAGRGNAGNVKITASDTVSFAGVGSNGLSSGVSSSVEPGGEGKGSDVEITTNSLSVTDGAQLNAATSGRGDAGNVKITASDTVSFAGVGSNGFYSGAFSSVAPGSEGKGGDMEITTNSLSVTDGAQLVASTRGQGNAGKVRITASDTVSFAGVGSNGLSSGAFSSVEPGGEGNGGDVEITTGLLSLTDGLISSRNVGTGRAGDIIIQTRQNLELDRSRIIATTQSGDGGDMRLSVGDLLLMRDRSLISTTAGEAGKGGDGGNITIDADFIVAVPKENSDITANAFEGRGGNINIRTQGIYGLEFREELTPLSDITASSRIGVDGEFQLDLLTNVDPSRGLAELPTDVVDASTQIDRRCTPAGRTQEGSSFTVTGRGGLPSSPNDPLQAESVITNWVTLDSDAENNTPPATTTPRSSAPRQLVEAQGWYFNEKGEVVLTASAPKVTPQGEWFDPAECRVLQSTATPQP